jgi:hypothetical protein
LTCIFLNLFIKYFLENIVRKEESLSIDSIEFDHAASEILTSSKSIQNLDLKSFLHSSPQDEHQVENMYQVKNYLYSLNLLI